MNGWTFTWQGGRQLAGVSNGTTSLAFTYNDSGLRTTKTVGNVVHSYTYQGSMLIADVTATGEMYFHYDQNGSIIGFTYDNGTTTAEYYYVKNLQGDILGILDSSGNLIASYSYDAWGNILTVDGSNSALANRNPIRYRGYYYDSESDLYYLQSRYYDAEVGRFINADAYTSTATGILGYNMFAYCNNNPVITVDKEGTSLILAYITAKVAKAGVQALIGAATAGAVGLMTGQSGSDIFKSMVVGGLFGAASEFCGPLVLATVAAGYAYVDNAIDKAERIKAVQGSPITEAQSIQISGDALVSAGNTFTATYVGGKVGAMAGDNSSHIVDFTISYIADLASGVFDWIHQTLWEENNLQEVPT